MNAKYIIQTRDKIIEFEAKSLDCSKCLQIEIIASSDKKWKGYRLLRMNFGLNGMSLLHIINTL
jgi:hypothetical protein